MDDKESIAMLLAMLKKYNFTKEEKEAVLNAIGIVDWVRMGKKRGKEILKKRKKIN